MLRVFVTHHPEDLDAYYGRALPELAAIADVVVNPLDRDLTTDELVGHAAGCDVIVAHRSTPGEAALFERRRELLAFLRCAVDISTIDIDAASEAGVVVARADTSYVASTSELALGLLLDVARNISASAIDYRAGSMPPQRPGFQLSGKTAGIVGFGAIGRYLAAALRGLGMQVLVHDPYVDGTELGEAATTFHDLLARSDIVFPLAASTPETRELIDRDALARMRAGAVLVNVSRGELVDESALAAALDSGHLRAAGLDVGSAPDQRPPVELASRTDVVATPHLGGLTPENADAQAMSSVEQVAAMIAGEMPPRAANPERAERLRRWWDSR